MPAKGTNKAEKELESTVGWRVPFNKVVRERFTMKVTIKEQMPKGDERKKEPCRFPEWKHFRQRLWQVPLRQDMPIKFQEHWKPWEVSRRVEEGVVTRGVLRFLWVTWVWAEKGHDQYFWFGCLFGSMWFQFRVLPLLGSLLYHLSHTLSPFCFGSFLDRILHFCTRLASNCDPPTSHVAGITACPTVPGLLVERGSC
jgi:hypothetical protein